MDRNGLYPVPPRESQPQPAPQLLMPQMPVPVGPEPILTTCPVCKSEIRTKVTHNATTKTHMMCCLLSLFTCCLCSCLPYCMNTCRNTNHYCPSCDAFIGTYQA